MDRLVLVLFVLKSVLTGTGLAQLRDPPRLFNRMTSFNCLIYPHAFHCAADHGCIPPERVHDGIKDCPNGSDESSSVNICDYAPYFPDFRCSAYADCISQHDGYACRCRTGYVGPGELCQPAPLNMPQFVTTAKPLIIQTWRTDSTRPVNGADYASQTSLHDLGNKVLERTTIQSPPETEGNTSIVPTVFWGARVTSRHPSKVTVRESRNIEESNSPWNTKQTTGAIHVVPSEHVACPSRTLMINESGQVWCLKLYSNGSVDYASRLPPPSRSFNILPSNFIPTAHANSDTAGTGGDTEDLPDATATGLDDVNTNGIAKYRLNELLEKLPKFVVTTSRGSKKGPFNSSVHPTNKQINVNISEVAHLQTSEGFNGVTEDGAMFGYMPTRATSRKPGNINPQNSVTRWAQGSIITPVKIWNSTGGALTAYRIPPNATLPASCLDHTVAMFLCANHSECITPDKLLDGHEECSDGSDEVPEFVDECAFAGDWPRFMCGTHADCIDIAPGYICKCHQGYFWDGNTCVLIPSDLSTLPEKVIEDLVRMDGFTGTSSNAANALKTSLKADDLPTSVDIMVYPGGSTWTVRSNNLSSRPLNNRPNQANPLVVLPNCIDCIRPEFVTLGPDLSSASGQEQKQAEVRDPNRSVSRTFVNNSNHSNLSMPSVEAPPDPQLRNTNNQNPNASDAVRPPPGITITGLFQTGNQISTRSDKNNAHSSNSVPNGEPPPDATAVTDGSGTHETGLTNEWQTVLAVLRRISTQSSTTRNPTAKFPFGAAALDPVATNHVILSNVSSVTIKYIPQDPGSVSNRATTPGVHGSEIRPASSGAGSATTVTGKLDNGLLMTTFSPVTPGSGDSRFSMVGQTISNVPPFPTTGNTSITNGNSSSIPLMSSLINGSTIHGMTLTGVGINRTETSMTTILPTGSTSTLRYSNGSVPETQATTTRIIPTQPDYFTIYRPSRVTVTLPPITTTGRPVNDNVSTQPAFSNDTDRTGHETETGGVGLGLNQNGENTSQPVPTKVTTPDGVTTSSPLLLRVTNLNGEIVTPYQITENSALNLSGRNTAPSALLKVTTPRSNGAVTGPPITQTGISASDRWTTTVRLPGNGNSPTSMPTVTPPTANGNLQMNEPLLLPDTASTSQEHGPPGNNTVVPVFLNLSTLRRNASVVIPVNNTSNITSVAGPTSHGITDNRQGGSSRPTAPSVRSDETDTVTVNSLGTTMVITTAPSVRSSVPRIQLNTTAVPQINPSTYPAAVFWSLPTSPQRTKAQNPVNASTVNDTGIPFDQMYECFPALFKKAYASLQQHIKNCDRSCDVNATEQCVAPAGRCECLPGTTRTSATGECQVSVQYEIGFTMAELCGKPLLFQSYMSDLSNTVTQQLAVVLCYQMEQLLNKSDMSAGQYSPGSCNPQSFARGSVISNVGLSFVPVGRDASAIPSAVSTALRDALKANQGAVGADAGGFKVKPVTISPSQVNGMRAETTYQIPSVGDINECDNSRNVCGFNADCQNNFGAFSCVCRPGYADAGPTLPGRGCVNASLILASASMPINVTIITCPPENFVFANLCLYKTYFILLIIAIIIACLIVLGLLACCIYCCCRNKGEEYSAPQVALIRAAQRSPRQPSSSVAPLPVGGAGYQQLKSEGPSLDPNAPRPGPSVMEPDVEKGLNDRARMLPQTDTQEIVDSKEVIRETVTETKVHSADKSGNDVDTWEEVEVPNFTQAEMAEQGSMRALSPSQGSTFSRTQHLEAAEADRAPEEAIMEETVNEQIVSETRVQDDVPVQRSELQEHVTLQRSEPISEEVLLSAESIPPVNKDSIGSVDAELIRTEYELPPSPSSSVKRLAAAKLSARKYRLEAQDSIRRASSETREWLAIPRTESLVMDDDGMDVDTLPDRSYAKDPLYSMNSPVAGMDTRFDDTELRRLGMGFRDSFDDVMEQTSRFYKESSSDVEFEREVDLSQLKDVQAQQVSIDGKSNQDDSESSDDDDHSGKITSIQREPAYILDQRGNVSSIEPLDEMDENERNDGANNETDRQSLKSTDEEELKNLEGSQVSLKDRKITVTEADAHDDAINEIVNQPAFYSRQASSDDEAYDKDELKRKIMEESAKLNLPDGGMERKPSEVQREIAIREFGALGERDSIDDMLDRTQPFFSRTSTLDSFQLLKTDSTDEASPTSRKPSQSLLGVDNTTSLEQSPRKRSLLKKRSAFHSRDSMNKIMETTSIAEDPSMGSTDGLRSSADSPTLNRDGEDDAFNKDDTEVANTSTVVRRSSLQKTMAIDDEDVADFFGTQPAELLTETVVRNDSVEEENKPQVVLMRSEAIPAGDKETGEYLEESVRKESIQSMSNSPRNSQEIEQFVYEHLDEIIHAHNAEKAQPEKSEETVNETVVRDELDDNEDNSPGTSKTPLLQKTVSLDGKSVSEQNLQQRDAQLSSPPVIPRDSDSGVYVDAGHLDSSSASRRKANIMSSQDDLQVLEGQEARRIGSGSSYQRLSQSDDEEEVIKRYSIAYKNQLKKTTKRVRHNYEMGPPESRHVYYSSRPKRMPPNREELDVWRDTTWWRIHRK